MRIVTEILAALLVAGTLGLLPGPAQAADDEGTIRRIDAEAQTITLDNGNTYKLPGEFNAEALAEGVEVIVAYETVDGKKQITDIVIYE
jgi:Cu/Ag efflux protein CusF